jgi:hypothetical protein
MIEFRQGDCAFRRRDDIDPSTLKPAKSSVIALGEATGHRHEVTRGTVMVDEHGTLYVVSTEDAPATIEHLYGDRVAEHGPIAFAPAVWEYVPQREYTDDGEAAVAD